MRRLGALGALLMLCCCITVPLPGGRHTTLNIPAAAVSLEMSIRSALRAARQRLAERSKTTKSRAELAELLDSTRADLRKSFPAEAEPLLVAVESTMDTEMRGLQASTSAGAIRLVRLPPDASNAGVQAAIDRIVAAIDHILSYDKLALPLIVNSAPTNAHFEMRIRANQQPPLHQLDTNQRLPNVWRGIYEGIAHKDGYKDATAHIDMINGGPTRVTCTLQRNDSAEGSTCHVE